MKIPDLSQQLTEVLDLCPYEVCKCAQRAEAGDIGRLVNALAFLRRQQEGKISRHAYRAHQDAVVAEILATLPDDPESADFMTMLEAALPDDDSAFAELERAGLVTKVSAGADMAMAIALTDCD